MPELPEIETYITALRDRILGQPLERLRIASVSLLRTWDPPVSALEGRIVRGISRLGKRIVLEIEDDMFVVLHLMIAGRLRWKKPGSPIPRRLGQAAFDFPNGTVLLTEAGTRRRASLHVLRGKGALAAHDRGGIEPLEADLEQFRVALLKENRTLKRALADPRLFSGIGNAHSDEILFEARLSPLRLTRRLNDDEIERLYHATRSSLAAWISILHDELGDGFPDRVTAFHPSMKVHGRHGQPCRVCSSPIQRIAYANSETNYCVTCQTGGRVLADRSLSRLLREDFPRTLEELEELEER